MADAKMSPVLSIAEVSMAIQKSNGEVGGRSMEMAEKEFILRVRGYITGLEDLRKVAVGVVSNGVPILLGDVANVQLGPDMRRGIAELDGQGETVGGIVVVRYGANAREVITEVKKRLDEAMKGLPPDVTYQIVYDRTGLIHRAVKTLQEKLIEESVVVALVCVAFLLFPQRAGDHRHSAAGRSDLLPGHVYAGDQFQYHVDGRHCHCRGNVQMAMRAVNDAVARGTVRVPSGYSLFRSGQYEYMLRAHQRLSQAPRQKRPPHPFLIILGPPSATVVRLRA